MLPVYLCGAEQNCKQKPVSNIVNNLDPFKGHFVHLRLDFMPTQSPASGRTYCDIGSIGVDKEIHVVDISTR